MAHVVASLFSGLPTGLVRSQAVYEHHPTEPATCVSAPVLVGLGQSQDVDLLVMGSICEISRSMEREMP